MILRLLLPLTAVALIFPISVNAAKANDSPKSSHQPPLNLAQRPPEPLQSDRDHAAENRHSRWMEWLRSLDLSDQQMEQIRTIYQQSRRDTSSLRQQLRESRERMYSMLTTDVDSDQIVQIHQQVQTLQQELENQRFAAMLEVRDVLTPEQRVRVADSLRQYQEQRRSHRRQ